MKMVIGGAYQGKRSFAQREYAIEDGWIDGADCAFGEIISCRGINHFHAYIRRIIEREDGRRALAEGQEEAFAAWLYQNNPDIVVISDELGCGIVPLEEEDRLWREMTGRICTSLAAEADTVVRVVAGIGMKLK